MEQFKATEEQMRITTQTREGREMFLAISTVRNYLKKESIDNNILSCMLLAANDAIEKTNKTHNTNFPPMEIKFNAGGSKGE